MPCMRGAVHIEELVQSVPRWPIDSDRVEDRDAAAGSQGGDATRTLGVLCAAELRRVV
jgi:hypothetical protein